MEIVKEISGCKIERREHKGNEYFIVWFKDEWNKFYSLKSAVEFAITF